MKNTEVNSKMGQACLSAYLNHRAKDFTDRLEATAGMITRTYSATAAIALNFLPLVYSENNIY